MDTTLATFKETVGSKALTASAKLFDHDALNRGMAGEALDDRLKTIAIGCLSRPAENKLGREGLCLLPKGEELAR
jgi:hypothetical protein